MVTMGVPAASADGTSDTEQYTGANGVGYPGGPPPFPSQNAAGEVGADSSVPNLFASLRSLFADLAGGGSTTSSRFSGEILATEPLPAR